MYYFFLGILPLPVTPGALTISTPSMNETKILINDGEINLLKSPGLREISFDFLLPQRKEPWMNYALGNYTATAYVPLLNKLKEDKEPFQFIVTRLTPDNKPLFFTNIKCQIEDYTYEEDAASLGLDVNCKILLKEYKEYGTNSFSLLDKIIDVAVGVGATAAVALVTKKRSPSTVVSKKTTPKTYTVQQGDTLWSICKQHLGDGQKYQEIAKLNNLENPDKITVGQVLRLKA